MTFPFRSLRLPRFYMSQPMPCPYLAGRVERRIYTELTDSADATALNDALNRIGFRRSQSAAYRPSCIDCSACISVRVRVADFRPSRSQKRVLRCNNDLAVSTVTAQASNEQYALLQHYLAARHFGGGMEEMSAQEYKEMVTQSPVESYVVEYREPLDLATPATSATLATPASKANRKGRLVGCCLTDIHEDGLSMVYSFYHTDIPQRRGLGTYAILEHIQRAADMGLPYVYMGYWVENAKRMAYKADFRPLEWLGAEGWSELGAEGWSELGAAGWSEHAPAGQNKKAQRLSQDSV